VRGQPFVVRGKTPKMPLRLLRALVTYGPEAAPIDHLCQVLWPDSDGDIARRTFDTTLHRLRRLLPDEGMIVTTSAGVQLDRARVWADAWQVEPLANTILHNIQRGVPPQDFDVRHPTRQLLRIVRGRFLVEEDHPRAVTMRERISGCFVKAIVAVGRAFEANGRSEDALAIYRAALDSDETSEILYERAITCHGLLGQREEATRLWHSCRRALELHFGVEPSRHTRMAFERAC
jgi:LuxR family maltose regulon positive regulatory protein